MVNKTQNITTLKLHWCIKTKTWSDIRPLLYSHVLIKIAYIQSCEDLSTTTLLKCNDYLGDGCWGIGVMSSLHLYVMHGPADSEQCQINHGAKLMDSLRAYKKEGQFGQWHSGQGNEEPTRLLWLDQRLHKAAALLNSTAQFSMVWYTFFCIFILAGLQTVTVVFTFMLLATSTPSWFLVKTVVWWQEFTLYSVNSHWFRLRI